MAMTVPLRTYLALGAAVGLLGGGYIFAPKPGAVTLPSTAAQLAPAAEVASPAAPAVKLSSSVVPNRPPVPLVTRTHDKYYQSQQPGGSVQTASATAGGTAMDDISRVSLTVGSDGAALPQADAAKSADSSRAKAAVELDGYKNVRGLEKGPDGVWRGRAMRGRTEIAIRVDDSGNVSAD